MDAREIAEKIISDVVDCDYGDQLERPGYHRLIKLAQAYLNLESALNKRLERVKKRKMWPEHLKSALIRELEMVIEDAKNGS